MNYAEMVQIDPWNLDKEWTNHPAYVMQCGEALADARKELDEAKEAYELTVSEADRDIRESAEKKPVEREIENMIIRNPDVQAAKQRLIEAKYNVGLLEAARAGFEARGAALSNLVKLHAMTYYAEPSADIEARGVLEEQRQQAFRDKVKIGGKGGKDSPDAGDGEPKMSRSKSPAKK